MCDPMRDPIRDHGSDQGKKFKIQNLVEQITLEWLLW